MEGGRSEEGSPSCLSLSRSIIGRLGGWVRGWVVGGRVVVQWTSQFVAPSGGRRAVGLSTRGSMGGSPCG